MIIYHLSAQRLVLMSRLMSLATLFSIVSLLAACGEPAAQSATKAGPPPRPVLVQKVVFADRTPERGLVGTIRPRIETELGFRVAGKVTARLVNAGDRVRAGDVVELHAEQTPEIAPFFANVH
jgi:multidrug efflux pump subunit AcrA (membrane-fusion protein)